MTTEIPIVRLPSLVGRQRESWLALIELAPNLGAHWLLIGGQMVFLHEVERGLSDMRPTDDVDVVVDVRVEPAGLGVVRVLLRGAGFEQSRPSADGVTHRYRRGGATIDVLAPDNLGRRASLALGSGISGRASGWNRMKWTPADAPNGLRNVATMRVASSNLVIRSNEYLISGPPEGR